MSYPENRPPLEHQRLLRLANEYRHKGYTVKLYPASTDLPAKLADCPFDLIAEGEGKKIAVEVRSRETLTLNGSEDLRQMSDLVHQLPGWEFELVITNRRKKES
ncbi:MAG: hypothetical protein HC866_09610 [Leptolyngbyaceae cyanobacterium RU_5_1]|nr:hypothetical protein [Leptolyngbyaceae cyanobacterium RU_5_1]